jgi:LacI family transcriptional regulator
MKIAHKRGYKIPENFSVIGFSNGILSRHSNPKLTTVSQHGEIMGETAAQLLIDKLDSKIEDQSSNTKVIQTDLVERNSTKTYLKLTK